MHPIDYETPRKHVRRSAFWSAFALAYLPGLIILNVTDDLLHMRLTGHRGDGGVMFLSFFVSPLFAAGAALVKTILNRYDTAGFAVAFAVFAPLLVYLLWLAANVL